MAKKKSTGSAKKKKKKQKPTTKRKPNPVAPGPVSAIPKLTQAPGCGTVDGSNKDTQGFLKDTQQRMHMPTHDSTAAAVANLTKCLDGAQGRDVNIVGHGWDGCISTGIGEGPPDPAGRDGDKVVKFDNPKDWTVLGQLKDLNVSSLTLWGCNTGAGREGAKLLWAIANLIGAPVSAPTGLVYPGNGAKSFRLEPRSKMQRAVPGAKQPKPRNPPEYLQLLNANTPMRVKFDGAIQSLPRKDLRTVHLYPGKPTDTTEWMSFTPGDAQKKRVQVRFDQPLTLPGPIPAMVTGTLIGTFRRNGQDEQRAFRVYNNRLVQDVENPETFYRAKIGPT